MSSTVARRTTGLMASTLELLPMAKDKVTPASELSYEQARDELAEVVQRLEAGGTTLEESLALWERGEALADVCQQWLDGAREKLATARAEQDDCRLRLADVRSPAQACGQQRRARLAERRARAARSATARSRTPGRCRTAHRCASSQTRPGRADVDRIAPDVRGLVRRQHPLTRDLGRAVLRRSPPRTAPAGAPRCASRT